jgi:hypothetical protein
MFVCLYKISKSGAEKKELKKKIRILVLEKKVGDLEIEKLKEDKGGLSKEELELIEKVDYTEIAAVLRINNIDSISVEEIDESISVIERNMKTYQRQKIRYPKLAKILNLHIKVCQETIKRYKELKELKELKNSKKK